MRLRLLPLALSGVLVASSACSDSTAPSPLAAPTGGTAYQGTQWGQSADAGGWSRPSLFEETIDPRTRNELQFGSYTLSLPARSVCRLDDSGYGVASFDEPCEPETKRVTIRAKVSVDAMGRQRIDLQPQMRFNPDRTVVLSMYIGKAELLSPESWRILFCPAGDLLGCFDESRNDLSLTTRVDLRRGIVYRRIKHFSGYLAAES